MFDNFFLRFINDLEETIRQWDLSNRNSKAKKGTLEANDLSNGQWVESNETLKFSKVFFNVTHYYVKPNEGVEDKTNTGVFSIKLPCS